LKYKVNKYFLIVCYVFLIIFEKKETMKILGYILKAVSIILLAISVVSIFNVISGIYDHRNEDFAFLIGYIIGSIIALFLIFWGSISLLKYSNKLILKSNSRSEISNIGEDL